MIKELAEQVVRELKKEEFSLREIHRHTGIHFSTIQRIKMETRRPTVDQADRLLKFFNENK